MKKVPFICLWILLLLPLTLWATATSPSMTTRVLSASPALTVIAAEFDETALQNQLAALEFDASASDGLGMILAVAGRGNPVANVLDYELGEAVAATMTVPDDDAAITPQELAVLSDPVIFRDLRLVTLTYRPVMRDPQGTLRIVRRVRVEVATQGSGGLNEQSDPTSFSSAFYPLYQMFVANLDELYPEYAQRTPGRYLVIGSSARISSLQSVAQFQSWLDLKKRKGYTMQVVSLTNATSESAIRDAIRQEYENSSLPELEYTVILGDQGDFVSPATCNPEHPEEQPWRVGDNYYFALVGTDSVPDVIHGRISGQSTSEYVTYFAKAFNYETNPYRDDLTWYRSISCVAGNNADGGNIFPVTPVWNVNWARDRFMRDGVIANADTFYYHGPADPPAGTLTSSIVTDVDSGVCAVFYRGWASHLGWEYPIFRNGEVLSLANGRRLPAVFGIVCGSGNFAYFGGQCLGETFTTGAGTPTQPKGAITFFGATDLHTNTRHNNAILAGITQAMMDNGIRSAGALAMAGKLEGWRQFQRERSLMASQCPSPAVYYILHVFNLLGDPELQIYFGVPSTMDVQSAATLTQGETLVPIIVQSGGFPVSDAMVTLRQQGSETIARTRTDVAGNAVLPANFTSTGTAQLTVWKSRHFLVSRDIPIVSGDFDPKITQVNWSAGADNLPNPGETVNFTLDIQNLGTNATTPSLTVTSLDSRVTVVTGTGSCNTIMPGGTQTSTEFSITLGTELYNGELPWLNVMIQDAWDPVNRRIQIPVAAPDPLVVSFRVADGGNGILEPNETAPIYVTIQNNGGQEASGLTATVDSWDNAVQITNSAVQWGTVAIGSSGESTQPFEAHLMSGVTPGRQIQIRFQFQQNGVVMARKVYTLTAGLVTPAAPTGPDAYGYYAYEDIDAGYTATPTYNWIELDPAHGGSGGEAHTVHDDTHFDMALPQPFTYYGQTFDHIWICSNGWFSFERMSIPEFRNWELPSPMGAPSLVAPFWDDLVGKSAGPAEDTVFTVWTRYDSDPGRFIIEWRSYNRAGVPDGIGFPNTAVCNFQAILEYRTGDGDILVQYEQIANVDNNSTNTGNYATVGIEDSYHQRGLNLTYSNYYAASVDTLRAGRAIRFTTTPPDNFNSAEAPLESGIPERFALHEAYPNPFNPSTLLRFDLEHSGLVSLKVYDILGRDVQTLVDGWYAAGRYSLTFNAADLPSGLYFARLVSGTNVQVQKLMLVK